MCEEERRSAPRVAYSADVVVFAAEQPLFCRTLDISAAGMLLLPSHRASQGLRMSIELGLPRLEHFRVDAVLARVDSIRGTYTWGVRFTGLSTRVRSMLGDFVSQRLEGVPEHKMVFSADRQHVPTRVVSPVVIPPGEAIPMLSRSLYKKLVAGGQMWRSCTAGVDD